MSADTAPTHESQLSRSRESGAIRGIVLFNLAIVATSWSRWFSGDASHVGVVDRVLGNLRLGGFRVDVVWLVLSTGLLAVAFLYFVSQGIRSREARMNAAFCLCGVVAFCLFIYRALTTGVLDFG